MEDLNGHAEPLARERQPSPRSRDRETETMMAFCIGRSEAQAPFARLRTNVPVPTPLAHEALIRVLCAGICGTDLAMMNDYKPGFEGALGHEFVGEVVRVGQEGSATTWLGKRVVGEINVPCNDKVQCRVCSAAHSRTPEPKSSRGRDPTILHRNHCPNRQALGIVGRSGAFAEYITLPLANLLVIPDNVTDSEATFTEPLAAAYRVVEQAVIKPSDSVAVLGDGRLGLLIAEVLAAEKVARAITLVGRHPGKLALMDHLVHTVVADHSSTAAAAETPPSFDELYRDKFNVVVECTGTPSGISSALSIVKPCGGRIIMKSTCAVAKTDISSDALALAARKGVEVIGSRCGPFPPALAALAAKRVKVAKFLAATFPLARAEDAIAYAKQRGVLKVQLNAASM
jgi:threonine dehydrogenase-like Zn-dependent dehydrogenase